MVHSLNSDKFYAWDTFKMFDISGEERHVMSITGACDKGILYSDIYAVASEDIVDGGSFFAAASSKGTTVTLKWQMVSGLEN